MVPVLEKTLAVADNVDGLKETVTTTAIVAVLYVVGQIIAGNTFAACIKMKRL